MKAWSSFLLLIGLITISSCQSKSGKSSSSSENDSISTTEIVQSKDLPSLTAGDVNFTEADFGEIIELQGTQKILDDAPLFKLSETQALIKDNYFIIQNHSGNENGKIIQVFSYPDLKFLFDLGERGDAPEQFLFPHLSPTFEDGKLGYLYDAEKEKLVEITSQGESILHSVKFRKEPKAVSNEKQMFITDNKTYYYSTSIRQGQAIFRAVEKKDSIETALLHNLAFSPKHKNWTAYIGDFCINPACNRMVYAYKYFKRICVMDMEAQTVRNICFDKEGVQAANDIITLGPDNVTYYWGISSTNDYFFLTYSGRTPIEVVKETDGKDGYIFVEQFDWNGNPIAKYKLDRWGRTICDGKNIYLFSARYDDPLFIYPLHQ